MASKQLTKSDSLNVIERGELERHEATIRRGRETFVEVGRALAEIRDKRLYRESFKSFNDYCLSRWDFDRTRAHQLIASAEVARNVDHGQQVPVNERQARPLAKLPKDEQPEAWREVIDTAPDGKVTASHVERVVAKRIETKPESEVTDDIPDFDTAGEGPEVSTMVNTSAPVDRVGRTIENPKVARAFDQADRFTVLMGTASKLKSEVRKLAGEPLGAFLNSQQVEADCGNVHRAIRFAKPYAVCPYCGGESSGCKGCREQGWVPEEAYHHAPAELKGGER